ncbi:hypothetical protein BCR33DRAFT_46598 [Rhizoclosmatium globosum]|uniref:Uncharacterized protein n=1 Tax=Rhizoclosmatium globosum TaxID=329046 RepID=A0A1Y2AVN1_9FUNG|nr:hypothetical protein BCR33DRAFT_46598 [Rhizoclosmatium globosum]|eukprot:ORY26619.1 hypothetical protein BCR33DRAFT_46598 [Rhizoclosmatium globosum]
MRRWAISNNDATMPDPKHALESTDSALNSYTDTNSSSNPAYDATQQQAGMWMIVGSVLFVGVLCFVLYCVTAGYKVMKRKRAVTGMVVGGRGGGGGGVVGGERVVAVDETGGSSSVAVLEFKVVP